MWDGCKVGRLEGWPDGSCDLDGASDGLLVAVGMEEVDGALDGCSVDGWLDGASEHWYGSSSSR